MIESNLQIKIEKIKKLGKNNLCILSDFDDTLTKAYRQDKTRASSSFSVFPNNPNLLSQNYSKETKELYDYYYHIEQDPTLSFEEKEDSMVEWWTKEFELYKKHNLSKDTITQIINENLMEIKEETYEFFKLTNVENIPTVIFSAGIYDLIHGFLRKIKAEFANIHVVANIFEYDQNNKFEKVKGDIITSMNKNFHELSHLPIYNEMKNKKTCIIIGDTTSDVKMSYGKEFEEILKIGFLNELTDSPTYNKKLDSHKKHFDIVIDGTQDFSKINEILKEILL